MGAFKCITGTVNPREPGGKRELLYATKGKCQSSQMSLLPEIKEMTPLDTWEPVSQVPE